MWKQGVPVFLIFDASLCWRQLLLLIPPLLAGPDLLVPNEYWLPGEVVPVHYDLKLVVHMDNLTTRGEVSVEVQVVKATFSITLQSLLSLEMFRVVKSISHPVSTSIQCTGIFTAWLVTLEFPRQD